MFVAGPKVTGGIVGKHPSLSDLGDGDLKYHTDFRSVYATLLDNWLGVDSRGVLHDKFDHLPLVDKAKKADAPAATTDQPAPAGVPSAPPTPAAPAAEVKEAAAPEPVKK
jgi:hypothetical protein